MRAAFRKEELGRKDDLWSWFYMCCELSGMRLPWTNNRDKETVLEMKEQTPAWQLCENLPGSFVDIIGYIKTLKYEDKPDYKRIREMLRQGCDDNDVQFEGTEWKWLWDRDPDACSLVPRKPGDEKGRERHDHSHGQRISAGNPLSQGGTDPKIFYQIAYSRNYPRYCNDN